MKYSETQENSEKMKEIYGYLYGDVDKDDMWHELSPSYQRELVVWMYEQLNHFLTNADLTGNQKPDTEDPKSKYKKEARIKRMQDKKDAKEFYGRG